MRLLLDTHVAIWSVLEPKQIPPPIRRTIQNSEIFVSAVSIFEIALKSDGRRNRSIGINAAEAIHEFEQGGFTMLALTARHAAELQSIAVSHPDPYDRLILAQAVNESLRLVTHDAMLSRYSDTVITW